MRTEKEPVRKLEGQKTGGRVSSCFGRKKSAESDSVEIQRVGRTEKKV